MSGESDSSNSFGRLVVFKFNIKRSLSRILYVAMCRFADMDTNVHAGLAGSTSQGGSGHLAAHR